MNYPSVKALQSAFVDLSRAQAQQIRDIMRKYAPYPCKCGRDSDPATADAYPYNVCRYYHDGKHRYSRMAAIDKILNTHGVESVQAGHNRKSPAFVYCNAGDTYAVTILKVRGHFRIGTWGDIVERGNYD